MPDVIGLRLYVEDSKEPARRTYQEARSVSIPKPHTVAVSPDGRQAYVTSQQPGKPEIMVVDVASGRTTQQIGLDKPPRDGEVSFDGKSFFFTVLGDPAVEVIDTETNKVTGAIPTGASPHS